MRKQKNLFRLRCANCDEIMAIHEGHDDVIDDGPICDNCHDAFYTYCGICGERVEWADGADEAKYIDGDWICNACISKEKI